MILFPNEKTKKKNKQVQIAIAYCTCCNKIRYVYFCNVFFLYCVLIARAQHILMQSVFSTVKERKRKSYWVIIKSHILLWTIYIHKRMTYTQIWVTLKHFYRERQRAKNAENNNEHTRWHKSAFLLTKKKNHDFIIIRICKFENVLTNH